MVTTVLTSINVTQYTSTQSFLFLKQRYMFRLKVSHLQAFTTFSVTRLCWRILCNVNWITITSWCVHSEYVLTSLTVGMNEGQNRCFFVMILCKIRGVDLSAVWTESTSLVGYWQVAEMCHFYSCSNKSFKYTPPLLSVFKIRKSLTVSFFFLGGGGGKLKVFFFWGAGGTRHTP